MQKKINANIVLFLKWFPLTLFFNASTSRPFIKNWVLRINLFLAFNFKNSFEI